MTELYVNNFRGFRDTFIPIDKVNFLIGENSTGKTSILKLIRVLSDRSFSHSLDLNSCGFHFGYFDELCDRDFFEIGFANRYYGDRDDDFMAFNMRFENENGNPKVTDIRFFNTYTDYDLHFFYEKNEIEYGEEFVNANLDPFFFGDWIYKKSLGHNSYKSEEKQKHNDIVKETRMNVRFTEQYGLKTQLTSFNRLITKGLLWLGPMRAEPQPVYSNYKVNFSPDGSHIPFLLKNLLPTPQSNGKERDAFQLALNKFGQDSGLFDKIEVKVLSDEQTSPIEIRVFFGENNVKISNVGYGVSQILPLIIEVLSNEKNEWYAIQQPEIHLHPRGQAAFGELIYDTQKADNKTFIIETHSDYIVDRFRLCVNKNKEETEDEFQVLFFERTNDGNQVTPIKIQPNGKYADDQPQSFQEFFIKEQLELIKL